MNTPKGRLMKRYSQNSEHTSSPEQKHVSTPSNKLKATRANSFREAPITHFLYQD